MRGEEIKDPRWLTVGDEPSDALNEDGRVTLLEMHEKAVEAFERLSDVMLQADFLGHGEIKEQAETVATAAEKIVVDIQEAADYWEVNL